MAKRSQRRNPWEEAGEAVAAAVRPTYRELFGSKPCNGTRLAAAVRAAPLFERIFPSHFISDEEVEQFMDQFRGPGSFMGIPEVLA